MSNSSEVSGITYILKTNFRTFLDGKLFSIKTKGWQKVYVDPVLDPQTDLFSAFEKAVYFTCFLVFLTCKMGIVMV